MPVFTVTRSLRRNVITRTLISALTISLTTSLVTPTTATAATAGTCTAAQARAQKLRFDFVRGSVQVCAKVGSKYRWRTATPAEAQRPYVGYLRPLPTTQYLDVSPELTGRLVSASAALYRDSAKLFAGFVAVGLKSANSPYDYDSIAVIYPYSLLGRAFFQGQDPASLNEGSVVTVAGRPVVFDNDGTNATYSYVGQTSLVLFFGDGTDPSYLTTIFGEWLTAHGAV